MKSLKSLAIGLLAAAGVANGSLMAAGSTYYLNDHLATTIGTADAAGEIAALEADAFGSPVAGNAPSRYTGKPYDSDMGAYVFPFRNYRAQEARWMSADPSGFPDGINSFNYACGVMSHVDPLGLAADLLPGYWRSTSSTWTALQYSNDISSSTATAFESVLNSLLNLGISETNFQLNFLQDSDNRISIQNKTDGSAAGKYIGTMANGGLDAAMGFTFSASAYATNPSNEIYSAAVTVAHELGHAIMDAPDPTDLAVGDHSALTAVAYENYVRTSLGGSYRSTYHGTMLDSNGWRLE